MKRHPTQGKYILSGRDVVPCDDLLTWADWFEHFDIRVKHTLVCGFEVSTIFLGVDMNVVARAIDPDAPPILFETIAFRLDPLGNRSEIQAQERCSTYDEAEAQHDAIVARFRAALTS